MKHIPLSRGQYAIVDDELYEPLMRWKWTFNGHYAIRQEGPRGARKFISMHRLLMETQLGGEVSGGLQVDHVNRNQLDNRLANLRLATRSQNLSNSPVRSNNRLGLKGVFYRAKKRRYQAYIKAQGHTYCLGSFLTPEDAARAYNDAALRLHGEFACLNDVA